MKKVYLSFVLMLLMLVSLGTMSLGTTSLKAESPLGTSFNFDFETQIGDDAPVVTDLGLKTYGSTVTIDAGSYNTSNEFVTYIVNGKVEWDLPENNSFYVTSDLEITALYKPTGTIAVAFMDGNQDMLNVDYVVSGGTATPPDISSLSKPGYVVNSMDPWSGSFAGVTEDTVLWVQYTSSILDTYTLTVTNGTADQPSYGFDEVATVTASGTGNFQYWERNGMVVSLNPIYSFTVYADTEVTAVFDPVTASPDPDSLYISLLFGPMISMDYFSYIGQFNVPDGNSMIEYGIIYSEFPGGITLDTPGITKVRSNHYNSFTNEFVRNLDSSITMNDTIRGYMITTDGVTETVTYSDFKVIGDVFISEYGESSSYKYLELYNGQGYSRSLDNLVIEIYSNGATTPSTTISLTGKLPNDLILDGQTLTITNADGLNFNGNDAIVLKQTNSGDGIIVDVIGEVGNSDPFGEDVTLNRKSTVITPNTVFDSDEWDSYPIDDYDLGSHTVMPLAPTSIAISGDSTVMSGLTIDLDVTYMPSNSTKNVVWISSNEGVASVDDSGVVTGVSVGNVTITAVSLLDYSVLGTHAVEVTAPVTYTVSFDSKDGDAVSAQTGILQGQLATEPDPAPTKTDYVFDGWYTSSDGGTTLDTQWIFATDPVVADMTLYAKWTSTSTGSLMIYEIYGGGGNSGSIYKNDYIVLYNSTSSTIDLTGYSVQYASSTGTSWQVTNLTGTIAAGGYYLIQEKAGSVGTTDLPTPDVIGTIAMSGTKGKVALSNSTSSLSGSDPSGDASVVDFVGYGSANAYEGTGPTPAPSNTKSVQRNSFVDSNDNSNDFDAVSTDLSYLE